MKFGNKNPDPHGVRILARRGTSTEWARENPVLRLDELAVTTDGLRFKLGDGETAWSDLPYEIDARRLIELLVTRGIVLAKQVAA